MIPALTLWASEETIIMNEPGAAYRSRDKLLTYLALHRAQVPIVHTIAFIDIVSSPATALGVRCSGPGNVP